MFGRKTGLLAVVAATMVLFGGCGTDGSAGSNGNGYNAGTASTGGDVTGRSDVRDSRNSDVTQGGNNLERNTAGMRTDGYVENGTNAGTTLGQDVRNAWDNVKNDVRDMGNNNGTNGNNDNMNHGTAKNK